MTARLLPLFHLKKGLPRSPCFAAVFDYIHFRVDSSQVVVHEKQSIWSTFSLTMAIASDIQLEAPRMSI